MDKQMIKDLLYGTIREMQYNKKFFYQSSFGSSYSYWTKDGEQELLSMIKMMASKVQEFEQEQDKLRGQNMLLEKLSREENPITG